MFGVRYKGWWCEEIGLQLGSDSIPVSLREQRLREDRISRNSSEVVWIFGLWHKFLPHQDCQVAVRMQVDDTVMRRQLWRRFVDLLMERRKR